MKTKLFLIVSLLLGGYLLSSCQKDNSVLPANKSGAVVKEFTENSDDIIDPFGKEHLNNFPDPFKTTTTIEYVVPKSGWVTIYVYNLTERYEIRLVSEFKDAGLYRVMFDGTNHPPGRYLVQLSSAGTRISEPMTKIASDGNGSLTGHK